MTNPPSNGQESWPFRLEEDAFGRLVLVDAAGTRHAGVEAVRAFPISDPLRGVSLIAADGKEIAWIDDLGQLPAALRQQLEQHLARREFVPVIRRIVGIRSLADKSEWQVETDRGATTFQVAGDHDVRSLDRDRALITDTHGVRYLIADVATLDPASRRYLERYL